jgi:D-xylose 1-dehydrogenase (NADP+, D-xylono-1,5-lactone-forming)
MAKIRVGLVGCGFVAELHMHAYRRVYGVDVEVRAVAARGDHVVDFARRHQIPVACRSFRDLIADGELDVIDICTPPNLHAAMIVEAMQAGKHVICEKPFSKRPEDVEAAFDAAERTGRLLTEAFMYRHNPQTAKLVELVREGAVGELRVVRSAFSYSLYDAENIRLRPDVDGGSLMDVGCYCVSGSRLLAGEPEAVSGQAYIGPSGTDWVFTGAMRFAGDVHALFDCGTCLPNRDELEVIGTEGSLFLDDPWHANTPVIEARRDGGTERIELDPVDSYRLELENLADAIAGEAPLLLGREDALGQARTIEALFRSAETGDVVRL